MWPGVAGVHPYLPDGPYSRDLQAQGACALRFFQEQVRKSKQVQKSEVLCMCLEKQIEIEKGF